MRRTHIKASVLGLKENETDIIIQRELQRLNNLNPIRQHSSNLHDGLFSRRHDKQIRPKPSRLIVGIHVVH